MNIKIWLEKAGYIEHEYILCSFKLVKKKKKKKTQIFFSFFFKQCHEIEKK
jgi:hypothetical protein